jgi:hypothetical protein
VVAELPAGYYRVRFEAPGLSTMRLQRVKVDVGSETRVDVTFLADNLPLNGWDGWPTRKIEYIADRWRRHGSARI